jgi:hypothetical protein
MYGEDENAYRIFVGNPVGKKPCKDLDVGGSKGNRVGRCRLDVSDSGWGPVADSC